MTSPMTWPMDGARTRSKPQSRRVTPALSGRTRRIGLRIAELYGQLAEISTSLVVELNRAVAISMAYGPEAGLHLVDQLVDTGALDRYHLLHSVRGDLLEKLGRHQDATVEFERAAALAQNGPEREMSLDRARRSGELAAPGAAAQRCQAQ